MMMPRITAFYAALSALLIVILAIRVTLQRRATRIGIGDNGDHALAKRVRAHANSVEFIPIALILLLVCELLAIAPLWLHVFGIAIVLGRILHAWGLNASSGVTIGRSGGYVLTVLAIIVMALVMLWQSVLWWITAL
jgi:uncharacterized membrane protein YecN with MAPEG domain